MGLLNKIENKAHELELLKQETLKQIEKECKKYQNKSITYISKKPRIYTIMYSNLKNTWSPEFYDFEYQFKAILYVLKHTEAYNLIKKWENIKIKGISRILETNAMYEMNNKIKENYYEGSYTIIKLHPDVIEFMDNLLIK